MKSIIQDWAASLGLRHQGVLVSAVRGCDSASREDASKWLVRVYRGCLLNAHCGDVKKAASFMIPFPENHSEFWDHVSDFLKSIDHYPNHWILHFLHACEITGHYYPDEEIKQCWFSLYTRLVSKFHLQPESLDELNARLGADEDSFRKYQK